MRLMRLWRGLLTSPRIEGVRAMWALNARSEERERESWGGNEEFGGICSGALELVMWEIYLQLCRRSINVRLSELCNRQNYSVLWLEPPRIY